MDKTIDTRATEFAEREYEVNEIDREALRKGYYWGAKDTMDLPLSLRLTDSERERIKGIYQEAALLSAEQHIKEMQIDVTEHPEVFYFGKRKAIESIFGKEFFNENKTDEKA